MSRAQHNAEILVKKTAPLEYRVSNTAILSIRAVMLDGVGGAAAGVASGAKRATR
jgi:hypothetical protein